MDIFDSETAEDKLNKFAENFFYYKEWFVDFYGPSKFFKYHKQFEEYGLKDYIEDRHYAELQYAALNIFFEQNSIDKDFQDKVYSLFMLINNFLIEEI